MSEQKLLALSESQLEAKTSTRRVVNLLSGSIAFEFWWSASSYTHQKLGGDVDTISRTNTPTETVESLSYPPE